MTTMSVRYRIFVSSTSDDLKDTRHAARDIILKHDWFPVLMENFSSTPRPTTKVIEHHLDSCDALILIAGARYGSLTDGKISYVQWEFNQAQRKEIPVIRLVLSKQARDAAPNPDVRDREKQEDFICQLQNTIHLKYFEDLKTFSDELNVALTALPYILKPGTGQIAKAEYDAVCQELRAHQQRAESLGDFIRMLSAFDQTYQHFRQFHRK